jgi:hypothetical protein
MKDGTALRARSKVATTICGMAPPKAGCARQLAQEIVVGPRSQTDTRPADNYAGAESFFEIDRRNWAQLWPEASVLCKS